MKNKTPTFFFPFAKEVTISNFIEYSHDLIALQRIQTKNQKVKKKRK